MVVSIRAQSKGSYKKGKEKYSYGFIYLHQGLLLLGFLLLRNAVNLLKLLCDILSFVLILVIRAFLLKGGEKKSIFFSLFILFSLNYVLLCMSIVGKKF